MRKYSSLFILLLVTTIPYLQAKKIKFSTYPQGAVLISGNRASIYSTPYSFYTKYLSSDIYLWKEGYVAAKLKRDELQPAESIFLTKWKNKFNDTTKYKTSEFSKFFTSNSSIVLSDFRDIVSETLSKNIPNIETPNVAFGSTKKSSRSRLKLAGEILKVYNSGSIYLSLIHI